MTGTVTFSNASVVTGGTAVAATAVTGTVTLSNGDVKSFTVGTLTPGQSSVQTFTTTCRNDDPERDEHGLHDDAREQHGEQHQCGVRGRCVAFNMPTPDPVPPVVAAPEPLPATGGGGGG